MAASGKALDMTFGMVMGLVLFFPFSGVFDKKPVPYQQVEYVIEKNALGYEIQATFEKTACVFEQLEVLGTTLSYTRPLYWYDVQGPQGNRAVGKQAFSLQVVTNGPVSSLKIVTQHMCSGELVETVFLETDLKGN